MIAKLDKNKGVISIEISYDERVSMIEAFDIATYHCDIDDGLKFTYFGDVLEDVIEKDICKDL